MRQFMVYLEDSLLSQHSATTLLATLIHNGFSLAQPIMMIERDESDPPHPYLFFEQQE